MVASNKSIMNVMMREVMKEVVCQVENSRSIGSTMTQERLNHVAVISCHSDTVTKLDLNQLLDEFIQKAPVRMNTFSLHHPTSSQ